MINNSVTNLCPILYIYQNIFSNYKHLCNQHLPCLASQYSTHWSELHLQHLQVLFSWYLLSYGLCVFKYKGFTIIISAYILRIPREKIEIYISMYIWKSSLPPLFMTDIQTDSWTLFSRLAQYLTTSTLEGTGSSRLVWDLENSVLIFTGLGVVHSWKSRSSVWAILWLQHPYQGCQTWSRSKCCPQSCSQG